VSARLPYIPLGCDQQGRLTEADLDARIAEKMQPLPAECGTEIGADQPRRGRHRPFGPVRQVLYRRRPMHTTAFVVMLLIACAARFLLGLS